jgi:putative SOS response-associated peptidase YedK
MTRQVERSLNPQLRLWGDWTHSRPGEAAPIIRRNGDELEMVELVWGLKPRKEAEQRPLINIRSEGRRFPRHRCLVPASEFFVRERSGERPTRWRFTLADGDTFYFAGIWQPSSDDWPEAYAVLTTAANPDVAPCSDRQMAVIPRSARMAWLDHLTPEDELLQPLPAGTFRRERAR